MPLLERDTHLAALDAALAGAARGEGATLLIQGSAGSGKTALLQEAVARAGDHGLEPLTARGSEIEQEFGFGLARQLLEPALTTLSATERDTVLAGPAHPAALAVAPERELGDAAPPDGFAMLHALHLVASALAHQTPRLLCVDDAHWGDASSLRALSYLAGRLAVTPLALIIAFREAEPGAPEDLLDQLRDQPGVTTLSPAPLGPESVATLVRARHPAADDRACQAAGDATAGNPLYLAELLRTTVANGTGTIEADAIQAAALPSLGDRVARRIAHVAPEAPALAAAMAVLGDSGPLAMAAELAGLGTGEAGAIAHQLRRIEILDREDPAVFVHPLVRRSVYDGLSTAERDRHHTAAADLVERSGGATEVSAAHRAAARPARSPEAASALVRAGADATARGAPDEAIRWLRRALAEEAPEPPRAQLLAALGAAEVAIMDPAALGHLGQALTDATDPALTAQVAVTLAPALFASGRWAESADVVDSALRLLGDSDPDARAQLYGIGLLSAGYSLALVDRVPSDPGVLDDLTARSGWGPATLAATRAAYAAHLGDTDLARELVQRALGHGELLTRQDRGIWATSHLLVALAELDEAERGLAVAREMQEHAERAGSLSSLTSAVSHVGWILNRQGDLDGAVEAILPQVAASIEAGNHTFVVSQLYYVQDALLERSGMEELVRIGRELDVDALGLAGTWMGAMVHLVRGRLHMAALEYERAVPELRSACAITRGLGMGPVVAPTRSLLALALPVEQRAEAQALVREELELARASGLARPEGVALRAAGTLSLEGHGADDLRQSAVLFEQCGARVEQARSLLALGGALRRAGARLEARDELKAAIELADACGADLLAVRARDELRAAGGRPRRRATSGPDALTASELRVARLAADGATTAEIALSLVVSAKTVETHLTHAYAKLGLSGGRKREQLAQALNGAGQR